MRRAVLLLVLVVLLVVPMPVSAANGEYPLDGDMNFFFWNDSSDLGAAYNRLSTKPQMQDATFLSVKVSSATGEMTIGSFVTEPFPAGTVMGPGLTWYRTYLNVSSAVGVTTYNFIPFNLSKDGVETRLFYGVPRTEDVDNNQIATEYLTSYARRNYTYFNEGDRLLIRVNASTSSVVERTVYFNIAGTSQASMVQVGYWLHPGSEPQSSEAIAIVFGITGGILGAVIILRRKP